MRIWPAALVLVCSAVAIADDVPDLAGSLPLSANTLTVVRVASIFGTARAQSQHWYEDQQERFQSGVAVIPPWVDTLVVGSLVHPAVPEQVWSAAIVHRPEHVTLESIAEREGNPVEELGGISAVRTRRDSYIAQPRPDRLTAYRPAHRLEAARWARAVTQGEKSSVSTYLQQAAREEGHVVLAMDLQDMLDLRLVERRLREDEHFAPHRQLVERLMTLMSGLRGVTLSVTISDTVAATVDIDFSSEVGPSVFSVKALFVSILDDLGASIDEFREAAATASGQTVSLSCSLSDDSLRRILSLIVTPSTPYAIPPKTPVETPPKSPADAQAATKKYVAAVNEMVADLQKANRRAKDYARTAAWHETFARKILELPTEGVAAEVVAQGDQIASALRALAASLRGEGVEVQTQQGALTYNVHVTPGTPMFSWPVLTINGGYWGGVGYTQPTYDWTSNLQQVREKQAEAIAKGAAQREQIWQAINDSLSLLQRVTK